MKSSQPRRPLHQALKLINKSLNAAFNFPPPLHTKGNLLIVLIGKINEEDGRLISSGFCPTWDEKKWTKWKS